MNFRISREWATPLTIGVFTLMAVTGALMFFHFDTALQKTLHEWAGWLMVAGVALHAVANRAGFTRYFQRLGQGAWLMAAFTLVTLASFFLNVGGDEGPSPPALAMGAIGGAPIANVAPLFGKTAEKARAELAAAGIQLPSDQASLTSALGQDRARMAQALRVLARRG